jgi:hypothetical protein
VSCAYLSPFRDDRRRRHRRCIYGLVVWYAAYARLAWILLVSEVGGSRFSASGTELRLACTHRPLAYTLSVFFGLRRIK